MCARNHLWRQHESPQHLVLYFQLHTTTGTSSFQINTLRTLTRPTKSFRAPTKSFRAPQKVENSLRSVKDHHRACSPNIAYRLNTSNHLAHRPYDRILQSGNGRRQMAATSNHAYEDKLPVYVASKHASIQ